MLETLGDRIRQARKQKGLKQAELALKLGISTSSVGQFEVGKNNPSLENLLKLTEILEVELNWLVKGKLETGITSYNSQPKDNGAFGERVELELLKAQLEKAEKLNEEYLQIIRNLSLGKDEVTEQKAGAIKHRSATVAQQQPIAA